MLIVRQAEQQVTTVQNLIQPGVKPIILTP